MIVGIMGGMGPAATGEFLLELTKATPAQTDQEHFRSIVNCDCSVPDRTTSILAGDDAPYEPIHTGINNLIDWGADIIAVPCNTAHAFINQFVDELPVPLVHIVEATLDEAERRRPDGSWITATNGTLATGLYREAAEKRGYRLIEPPSEVQDWIMELIGSVKAGDMDHAGVLFDQIAENLLAIEDMPLVMACTEIPLGWSHSQVPSERVVSSLTALAEATVKKAKEMQAQS